MMFPYSKIMSLMCKTSCRLRILCRAKKPRTLTVCPTANRAAFSATPANASAFTSHCTCRMPFASGCCDALLNVSATLATPPGVYRKPSSAINSPLMTTWLRANISCRTFFSLRHNSGALRRYGSGFFFLHHGGRFDDSRLGLDGQMAQHGIVKAECVLQLFQGFLVAFDIHQHVVCLVNFLNRVSQLKIGRAHV